MELRHIQGFVAVAQELHFGRAASRLHIAQPALSQQIAALERDLGASLFDRNTRSVALTQEGKRLLPLAKRILDDIETARRAVLAGGELVGRVTFGFAGASAHAILPKLTRAIRAEHPGIHMQLHGQVYSGEAVNRVAEGNLDLALVRLPVKRTGVATLVVQHERLVAVLPSDHRLAAEADIDLLDLADEPFVAFPGSGGSSVREALVRTAQEAGFTPQIAQEAPDSFTILDLVGAGVGVTLTVSSVTARAGEHAGIVVRPLRRGSPIIESALAWREDNDSSVMQAVLDTARRTFPSPLGESPADTR